MLLFDHVLVVVYVNSDASIDSMVIPRALVRNAVPVKVKRFLNSAPGVQFTVEDEGRLRALTFYFWESHPNSTARELQDSLTTGF